MSADAPPPTGADAGVFEARLTAMERRLAALEEGGANRPQGRQEPLENRVTLLEQRFSLLDEDALALGERVDVLEATANARASEAASSSVHPLQAVIGTSSPQLDETAAARDEEAHSEIARLTTRLSEMESDLRSTVERVSILRASELVSVHEHTGAPAGADPRDVEALRRELGELRSAVEALVMALSLGLGRKAA